MPFDFQGTYVLCSDMIRRFALAAEAGGFVSASCSTDATVAVAADTILAHNQKTVMRYPSQCATAKDRRATQAVSQQLQAERASASEQAEQACHDRYTAQLREAEARHAAELEAAAASGGAAAVAEARREAHQVRNPFS